MVFVSKFPLLSDGGHKKTECMLVDLFIPDDLKWFWQQNKFCSTSFFYSYGALTVISSTYCYIFHQVFIFAQLLSSINPKSLLCCTVITSTDQMVINF